MRTSARLFAVGAAWASQRGPVGSADPSTGSSAASASGSGGTAPTETQGTPRATSASDSVSSGRSGRSTKPKSDLSKFEFSSGDPFRVLGIRRPASKSDLLTKEDIRAAFLDAVKVAHPDSPTGSAQAFRQVETAYRALRRNPAGGVDLNSAEGKAQQEAADQYDPHDPMRPGGFYDHPHHWASNPRRSRPDHNRHATRTKYDEGAGRFTEEGQDAPFMDYVREMNEALKKGDYGYFKRKREEQRAQEEMKKQWDGFTAEERAAANAQFRIWVAWKVFKYVACAYTLWYGYWVCRNHLDEVNEIHQMTSYPPGYFEEQDRKKAERDAKWGRFIMNPEGPKQTSILSATNGPAVVHGSYAHGHHASDAAMTKGKEVDLHYETPAVWQDAGTKKLMKDIEDKQKPPLYAMSFHGRPFTPEGLAEAREERRRKLHEAKLRKERKINQDPEAVAADDAANTTPGGIATVTSAVPTGSHHTVEVVVEQKGPKAAAQECEMFDI